MEERSKTGAGAFWLRVNDDGSVETRCGDGRCQVMKFTTVKAAHDWHRDCSDDPSDWNIAYHLEDFEAAPAPENFLQIGTRYHKIANLR